MRLGAGVDEVFKVLDSFKQVFVQDLQYGRLHLGEC